METAPTEPSLQHCCVLGDLGRNIKGQRHQLVKLAVFANIPCFKVKVNNFYFWSKLKRYLDIGATKMKQAISVYIPHRGSLSFPRALGEHCVICVCRSLRNTLAKPLPETHNLRSVASLSTCRSLFLSAVHLHQEALYGVKQP